MPIHSIPPLSLSPCRPTGSPFYVHDSTISVGDDNIAQHVNDTIIEDCNFGTGHGASIGSIDIGYIQNVTFKYVVAC